MIVILLLMALPHAHAESRAERLQRWRAELANAARIAPESPADAERRYRAVVGEADAAGDAGLLTTRAVDGLADVLRTSGRCEEAVPLYRRSAKAWKRQLGANQPRAAVTLHHLGLCLADLGRSGEAESALRQALEIWVATYGDGAAETENTRRALRGD
jgi:tetratricopeptide (TPR) repeat protein